VLGTLTPTPTPVGQNAGALRSLRTPADPSVASTVTAILATLTTAERIANVPSSTWWTIGLIIAGVFVVGPVFRKLRETSGISFVLIALGVLTLLSAHWVRNRTEPAVLTPWVDLVAQFFPMKPASKR
jgi:hypothetical protein